MTGLGSRLVTYYRFATDPIGVVSGRFRRFGDVYHVPDGQQGLYVMRHPDHLHEVLVERAAAFDKGHSALERMRLVLGSGLLTSDGQAWRRHRRMLQPAFARARLVAYAAVMAEEAEALCRSFVDGQRVDVSQEMMRLTLAIVCRTLFSHDAAADTSEVARAMAAFQDVITRPDLLPSWLPSPGRRRLADAVRTLDAIIYQLVRERRSARENSGARDDLLERLVSAADEEEGGSRLTETEIRDELVTLFLAGHETTAQTLTFTLYLLARHPEILARLQAEADEVLGGRTPRYEDLERLPLNEQVVSEALRLYPPAYLVARRATEDTEVGGYPIARGSEVALWIYMTQRDPRWYPEPLAFRPERMAERERAKLPRGAYLPFGLGARTCIGKTFALIEARIVLAVLVQRFVAECVSDQPLRLRPRVTLTVQGGMPMRLRTRRPIRAQG